MVDFELLAWVTKIYVTRYLRFGLRIYIYTIYDINNLHKNNKNRKSEIFVCKMFFFAGISLDMWCKFGRSISFRLEHWYTMDIPQKWGCSNQNAPAMVMNRDLDSPEIWSPVKMTDRIAASGEIAMFVVLGGWEITFLVGTVCFFEVATLFGFFPAQLWLKTGCIEPSLFRKTSGRSLGANFSCYIWQGVPYKEEGHSLLWKTGWKWLRGLATAVAVAVVGTHLTSN